MSNIDFIKSLRACGIPADQILDALIKVEEEKQERVREENRLRKQRQRSRMSRDVTDVTDVTRDTCDPLSPLEEKEKEAKRKTQSPLSPTKEKTPKGVKKKSSPFPYDHEFEDFWKAYPPNGASKRQAAESWQKATARATTAEILAAVVPYGTYCRVTGTTVAHATTWLNQDRWTVDYENLRKTHEDAKQHTERFEDYTGIQTSRVRSVGGGGCQGGSRKSKWEVEADRLLAKYEAEDAENRAIAGHE